MTNFFPINFYHPEATASETDLIAKGDNAGGESAVFKFLKERDHSDIFDYLSAARKDEQCQKGSYLSAHPTLIKNIIGLINEKLENGLEIKVLNESLNAEVVLRELLLPFREFILIMISSKKRKCFQKRKNNLKIWIWI